MSETLVREALLEYRRELLKVLGSDLTDLGAEHPKSDTYVIEKYLRVRTIDALLASQRHIDSLASRLREMK